MLQVEKKKGWEIYIYKFIYTSESGWTFSPYNIFYLNRKKTENRGQRQSWRALHMQQLLFVSYE